MLEPGSIFIDKYKIERQLGEGGMGKVFLATHVHLADQVAIKVLHREMTARTDLVDRFLREARASVRLKTEHVVRILDADRSPDGLPYIVMEYLDGCDLNAMFRQRGALPVGELVDYMLQTCEAMAEAHAQALVHRDIKPANLFVAHRSDGSPLLKVLDFGISKTLDRDLQLTSSQAMLGTPAYMSPEQLRASRDVDTRTDLWSLGVVMFELLTGGQPFDAPTFGELVLQVVTQPAPPVPGNIPRGLGAAITRCLQRDPMARFQTIGELAAAIAPFASNRAAGVNVAQRTATILKHRSQPVLPIVEIAAAAAAAGSHDTVAAGATTEMTSNGAVHAISEAILAKPSMRRGWIAASVAVAAIAVVAVVALTSSTKTAPVADPAAPTPITMTPSAAPAPPPPVPVDAGVAIAIDAAAVAPSAPTEPKPATASTKHQPPHRPAAPQAPPDPLGTRL